MSQKYSVNQHLIETLLAWVKSGEIAIPEIQRPFVWDATQVRDLLDSLYQGYPVGYIIAWKNPTVRLKDGTLSEGKKILIDGQQRVTALTAALLGQRVVNKEYKSVNIKIAFHPIDERFEVSNPAIERDSSWFPDVCPIVTGELRVSKLVKDYCDANPDTDANLIEDRIELLKGVTKKQIGMIELAGDLDIETVTEIFIRINSKGVVLSQADFAMSKIAANEELGGNVLRKAIDYFCHLARAPEFAAQIEENDKEFVATPYWQAIKWLKQDNEDLYDPSYSDLLRVAFMSQFPRGKIADLVGLLSGRNFETRTYEREIEEDSYKKLTTGVMDFVSQTHFQRILMIIKSAGFVTNTLIRSAGALNFSYVLYLRLKAQYGNDPRIETWVRRWFVMSLLTGRYSSSPESSMDFDIRQIHARPFDEILAQVEAAELSSTFWDVGLVQDLNTSSNSRPSLHVYWAAQAKLGNRGLFSKDIKAAELLVHQGDIHHIFPKNFLKGKGNSRAEYNQVANYALTQQEINIKIGDKNPSEYFAQVFAQCESGNPIFGGIQSKADLLENLRENCIPVDMVLSDSLNDYSLFLAERRILMAKKIRDYYHQL
jgi:hypothetical protein